MATTDDSTPTRRHVLKGAGGLIAAAAFPAGSAQALGQAPAARRLPNVTGRLARYMVESRDRTLPAEVVLQAKHRILDTLAAIVSGAHMTPGEAAIRYVRTQGGTPEASVFTTDIRTTAVNAAFANAMFAHADETDDFEPVTKAHPGCAVVPAAFAVAEREGRSGTDFLKAVVLGYDLCCRFLLALGPDHVRGTHRSAEGTSSTFGAVGGAAGAAQLDERGMRFALSYAAQQVSGIWSWVRDSEHIEKAFDFAGMGARNGVSAALMVQSGFTGVDDVLDGEHNMIDALSTEPRPEEMVADLGTRYYVTDVLRRISHPGPCGRAPHAAAHARPHSGQRRTDRRSASGGRRAHREQPRHAGCQSAVRAGRRASGRYRVVCRQPFTGAHEGPSGGCGEGTCGTHRGQGAHGSGRTT